MKRWMPAFLIALACTVPILLARSSETHLLEDRDTRAVLFAIRERNAPLSWFSGDWPLGNHFYRPIPALSFELDNALSGDSPVVYGWTNALLCAACTLMLFWFLREWTDTPWMAAAGSALFALWQVDRGDAISRLLIWLWVPVTILGFWRRGRKIGPIALALLSLVFLSTQISGQAFLEYRMIAWLPGRTASIMTLFCLIALAAYSRYERLTAGLRPLPTATALDPNLPMKAESSTAPNRAWLWLILVSVSVALALGSYEQAVMLPAALACVASTFWLMGRRPHWWVHAGFLAILGGYLLLRRAILPSDVSGYQAQQLRDGPAVMIALMHYLLPAANLVRPVIDTLQGGWTAFLIPGLYQYLMIFASSFAGYWVAFRSNVAALALGSFALSFVAFLPMAWVKPFEHYDYWPMAMRALFVVLLGAATWKAMLIASSPPAVQAPQRPDLAPGSLPRR